MKGIVFNLLEDVVCRQYGDGTWDRLLEAAGDDGVYTSLGSYPDDRVFALVRAAAHALGQSEDHVLRWFGRQSMPLLAERYPMFFAGLTGTRPFLLTLNDIIHPEVRKLSPGACVPVFDFDSSSPEMLAMGYRSDRKLCVLAHGFIEGAADYFHEEAGCEQRLCMHRGDPKCLFELRFRPQAARRPPDGAPMSANSGAGESARDRRFTRERRARLQAEAIAEQGLRDLFQRQQEIQLLATIAEAANSARTVAEAMQSALDAICEYTKWPIGHYCAVVSDALEDERRIVSTETWHIRAEAADRAATHAEAARLAGELGLAGRILKSGAAVWIDDIDGTSDAAAAARCQFPGDEKPHAAFGLPVLACREVAAVLEFLAPASAAPDHARLELFTHIAVQLGRVIERDRAQAQTADAFHDSLTQLPNRALFLRYVQRAIKRRDRYESYRFAVLFVDLDGFTAVKDSLGRRAGDEILVKIGARLSRIVRATDRISRVDQPGAAAAESTVARLGGDEFTLLLEDLIADSDALQVADRIHKTLAEPLLLENGSEIVASASIGIACSRPEQRTAVDVLQDADIAMYRAKAAGKRRSAMFDQQLHEQAITRLQLETDLRRAVERRQFCLVYQPIVSLDTGATLGFEALLRWRHPWRGLLEPADFMAIAESGGAIVEVGAWVLREACRQLRAWQERYGQPALSMAVNLSPKQFAQKDLATLVGGVLSSTGVSADRLSLEITDSAAMGAPGQARQQLSALGALGVELALDDFGTGHSSLSFLGQFRFHCLKIDRSFVRQLNDNDGITFIRTIVSLGSSLGLRVIAEGVETAREADRLRHIGCLYAQGFHFSRPVTADEIEKFLERP